MLNCCLGKTCEFFQIIKCVVNLELLGMPAATVTTLIVKSFGAPANGNLRLGALRRMRHIAATIIAVTIVTVKNKTKSPHVMSNGTHCIGFGKQLIRYLIYTGELFCLWKQIYLTLRFFYSSEAHLTSKQRVFTFIQLYFFLSITVWKFYFNLLMWLTHRMISYALVSCFPDNNAANMTRPYT